MNISMILFIIWAVSLVRHIVLSNLNYEPSWLEVLLPEAAFVLYLLTEAII